MIPPLAGAKSKITSRVEERKMAPERRAKLNLAFHLSFPPKRCLPTNPTQCQMFQMFSLFLPPAQLQIPESGKKKKKKKINAIQMCLSPLAWIKDFFQVQCISSRPNLCTLRNATWQSGQGCSFAVLFMSNPSFCSPMLRLTDVFSGSQHTENTWQTEAPGLLGQSTANDMSEMIPVSREAPPLG